jgi:hypothetical protein
MIKRGLLLLFTICFVTAIASYPSPAIKVNVSRGQKALFVNDQALHGDWDFKYSISRENVSTGDADNGPFMSYITNVIRGFIITSSPNQVIENSCKKDYCFKLEYVSEKNESVIFKKCKVVSISKIKDEKGKPKIMYSFEADSAEKR